MNELKLSLEAVLREMKELKEEFEKMIKEKEEEI